MSAMENIQKLRLEKVQVLMARHNLGRGTGVQLRPGQLERLTQEAAAKGIPLHLPYNRNNLRLVTRNGAITF